MSGVLQAENEALRQELWSQWLDNHSEHCQWSWPHKGACDWPLPDCLKDHQ